MIRRLTFITALFAAGCLHPGAEPTARTRIDSLPTPLPPPVLTVATPRPDLHIKTDTINIPIDTCNYSTYYSKDLNEIIDYFPALYQFPPVSPDSSYKLSGIWVNYKDSSGEVQQLSFGSEVGRDEYYLIYAWFLNKKLSATAHSRAEKLAVIYRIINSISNRLERGGTYFGHMYRRIAGISAYDGYMYAYRKQSASHHFETDKKAFIRALKKYISQRTDADIQIREANQETKIQILSKATTLSNLLTDSYYLKMAKEFMLEYNLMK